MRTIIALLQRNLLKLMRDRMKLFMNLFMSCLFLFIFSFVMKSTTVGVADPMNYLIAGIIIMTVFQSSLSNSMNILDDISSGFMKEILVAPISRWQIAIGHILSSTLVSIIQGIIIVITGLFIGLQIDFLHGLEMVLVMVIVSLTFSAMGLYLATITRESSNFQLLVTLITFPLTFLSGAYIPTMVLPKFLIPVVYINPLTYTTAAFRYVTLKMESFSPIELVKSGVAFNIHGFVITPWMSCLFVVAIGALFLVLCVQQFSKADFSKVKTFKRGRH
jgi:ABC-2 type transport system permease protein